MRQFRAFVELGHLRYFTRIWPRGSGIGVHEFVAALRDCAGCLAQVRQVRQGAVSFDGLLNSRFKFNH